MAGWTLRAMPPQAGRVALVTGATGGIGFEVARALAQAGAEVLLGARDAGRAAAAMARIAAGTPGARMRHIPLDLADLGSVRAAAAAVAARRGRLDLLLGVAGVMALPHRHLTADGFEMQLGVNFLGPFALTALLMPLLRQAPAARVVTVTSLAARLGRLRFEDLQGEARYGPWRAYAQSKLAALCFAIELQRRSTAAGWGVASLAAHPGLAMTDLYAKALAADGGPKLITRMMRAGTRLFPHSAEAAAGPILFAATAPEARPGGHYGRCRLCELRGPPGPARLPSAARDPALGARLWAAAETLTGIRFPD